MAEPLDPSGGDVERDVLRLMLRSNAELLVDRLEQGPVAERGSSIATLAAATSLGSVLDDIVLALVRQARSEGSSWAAIGYALQVSRQAAFQRFGPRIGEVAEIGAEMLADAPERATKALRQFLAGEFEALQADFDERMRDACSVELLDSVRSKLNGELGKVLGLGDPSTSSMSVYTVVDIPIAYEKGKRKGRVAIGPDARIAGLFVLVEGVP
ncbi:MAG: DUF3887 domain-containing protein [Acidimicrobiales bacterium]